MTAISSVPDDPRRGSDGFVVLPISILLVDRTYQRRYDHGMVLRLLAQYGEFDMVASGPILVSHRASDLKHYVVDGQHRVGLATEAGESEILAEILEGYTQEEEARLRVQRHSRKPDNALEMFHARLAAGNDAIAISIDNAVRSYGGEIALDFGQPGIRAVMAVQRIYLESPERLNIVLSVLKRSWTRVDRTTATSYMLLGMAWFFENHGHQIDEERLVRRLRSASVKQIDMSARVLAVGGGSMWKNYYRAIVKIYNYRTSKDDQLVTQHA